MTNQEWPLLVVVYEVRHWQEAAGKFKTGSLTTHFAFESLSSFDPRCCLDVN